MYLQHASPNGNRLMNCVESACSGSTFSQFKVNSCFICNGIVCFGLGVVKVKEVFC